MTFPYSSLIFSYACVKCRFTFPSWWYNYVTIGNKWPCAFSLITGCMETESLLEKYRIEYKFIFTLQTIIYCKLQSEVNDKEINCIIGIKAKELVGGPGHSKFKHQEVKRLKQDELNRRTNANALFVGDSNIRYPDRKFIHYNHTNPFSISGIIVLECSFKGILLFGGSKLRRQWCSGSVLLPHCSGDPCFMLGAIYVHISPVNW